MSDSTNGERLRVLFVDDEAMIREVMRIELPRMGHEVTVCDGGAAAISASVSTIDDDTTAEIRNSEINGDGAAETAKLIDDALFSKDITTNMVLFL